jgi:hypothetical protein
MLNSPLKIALHGVDHLALIIGRACSLKDNPVLGIYDPDPQKALRGALFLGVSALASANQLLAQNPDILVCCTPLADNSPVPEGLGLVINLYSQIADSGDRHRCWARQLTQLSDGIPDQITSELPALLFELTGHDESCHATADYLEELGFSVTVNSRSSSGGNQRGDGATPPER